MVGDDSIFVVISVVGGGLVSVGARLSFALVPPGWVVVFFFWVSWVVEVVGAGDGIEGVLFSVALETGCGRCGWSARGSS